MDIPLWNGGIPKLDVQVRTPASTINEADVDTSMLDVEVTAQAPFKPTITTS